MKVKISGLLQTTRSMKSLFVASTLAIFSGSLLYGIGAFLFLAFSFVFNDWIDSEKDSVGHPNRAIPIGKITKNEAAIFSAVLLVLGLGLTALFLTEYLKGLVIAYLFSVIYSWLLKPNWPIIATPIWSTAVSIVFLLPFTNTFLVYFAFTSIICGYELALDYRDREADKKFIKKPTLANLLGDRIFVISGGLFLFGVVILIQYF